MTNEDIFINSLFNRNKDVKQISETLKTQYGVTTNFDEETGNLKLEGTDSVNLIEAKKYVEDNLTEGLVQVIF